MGALLAGLVESRSGTPWTSVALLVAGAALLGAFVAVQARRRAPLIDLALFRSRGFVAATVGFSGQFGSVPTRSTRLGL